MIDNIIENNTRLCSLFIYIQLGSAILFLLTVNVFDMDSIQFTVFYVIYISFAVFRPEISPEKEGE